MGLISYSNQLLLLTEVSPGVVWCLRFPQQLKIVLKLKPLGRLEGDLVHYFFESQIFAELNMTIITGLTAET